MRRDVTVVNIPVACDSERMIDSADPDPRKPYHHGSLRSTLIEASIALALRRASATATPNARIVSLADQLLGRSRPQ